MAQDDDDMDEYVDDLIDPGDGNGEPAEGLSAGVAGDSLLPASTASVTGDVSTAVINQMLTDRSVRERLVRMLLPDLQSARTAASVVKGVSPKDVRLETFTGNSDPEAHAIDPDEFFNLLEWLDVSEFKLKSSGLAIEHHVPVLLQHLRGAAMRVFVKYNRDADTSQWTFVQAKLAIARLVPDSEVLFTSKAIGMTFSRENLATDIERFALYLTHGELTPDGKKYFFSLVARQDGCGYAEHLCSWLHPPQPFCRVQTDI